jgi:hypothetical protein
MMQTQEANYVDAVLDRYRRLPDVATRPRRQDRLLALDLHRRGVSLMLVETAMALATLRRRTRPANAAPLAPVRSLHYYSPIIEELLAGPPGDAYLEHLRDHLASHALSAPVQKTTFSDDR